MQMQGTSALQQQQTISRKRRHSSSSYFPSPIPRWCCKLVGVEQPSSPPKVVTFLHYTKSMAGNYTVHSLAQCGTAWVGEERGSTAIQTPSGTGQSVFPGWNRFRMRFANSGDFSFSRILSTCIRKYQSTFEIISICLNSHHFAGTVEVNLCPSGEKLHKFSALFIFKAFYQS